MNRTPRSPYSLPITTKHKQCFLSHQDIERASDTRLVRWLNSSKIIEAPNPLLGQRGGLCPTPL